MQFVASFISASLTFCATAQETAPAEPAQAEPAKPNFLIVVADDLGWSDIGALGGEIRTPTLDALASEGMVMTQYYVAPTCSPTRAMLMTGMDNHPAGVGTMHNLATENQTGRNYGAQLHDAVVTLPEALSAQGYETFMSGKWHLAIDEDQQPQNRGFQRSFVLLPGGASHFGDMKPLSPTEPAEYLEDGVAVELDDAFYSSIAYTDKLLNYLKTRDKNKPFLAYLAYTAPHDPLQVPNDWLDRYRGAYDSGPDAVRAARVARLRDQGLFPKEASLWQPQPFPSILPNAQDPWDDRDADERAESARRMEIYAAMVELMDEQLGRIIDYLRQQGELDNTYVIFFSDNGASSSAASIYPDSSPEWVEENWSLSPADFGKPGSFTVMSREWAHVSNTPWRLFKAAVAEGGIRSPFVVRGPGVSAATFNNELAHASDIAPTLFELAGIDPGTDPLYRDKLQPTGVSLVSVWRNGASTERAGFGVELFGNVAFRDGPWKVSKIRAPMGNGQWELFNMESDPGETENLASQHPEILQDLIAKYDAFVEENGVIHPINPFTPSPRAFYPSKCDLLCELRFYIVDLLPQPN
ncbi:MAG: arylsulfatase [Pseudomonadota bacterium]